MISLLLVLAAATSETPAELSPTCAALYVEAGICGKERDDLKRKLGQAGVDVFALQKRIDAFTQAALVPPPAPPPCHEPETGWATSTLVITGAAGLAVGFLVGVIVMVKSNQPPAP